jgi:hypothetical protein
MVSGGLGKAEREIMEALVEAMDATEYFRGETGADMEATRVLFRFRVCINPKVLFLNDFDCFTLGGWSDDDAGGSLSAPPRGPVCGAEGEMTSALYDRAFALGSGPWTTVCSGTVTDRNEPKLRALANRSVSATGGGTRTRVVNRLDGSV